MTTFVEKEAVCGACGETVEVTLMGSTNRFGYPDLDLRPPEMMRSTMWMWLKECTNCGYCAEDIGEIEPEEKAIVRGDSFIKLRQSIGDLDDMARRFRTAAFIAAEQGFHASAFQHTLHEAWVHDDCKDPVHATAARLNSVDLLTQVHREGIKLSDDDGGDAALAADLLRRAGEFQRSGEVCQKALDEDCADHVQQVLEFELELCASQDADCHTMEEVFGDGLDG